MTAREPRAGEAGLRGLRSLPGGWSPGPPGAAGPQAVSWAPFSLGHMASSQPHLDSSSQLFDLARAVGEARPASPQALLRASGSPGPSLAAGDGCVVSSG